MDFDLGEEQSILKDTLRRYLKDHYGFEQRRRALRAEPDAQDLWPGLAELGLLGAPFALERGGYGGGAVEAMVVMEALGEALVCDAWNESVLLCGRLLEGIGTPSAAALLSGLIAGTHRLALAHWESGARRDLSAVSTRAVSEGEGWRLNGAKSLSIGAPHASHLLVTARTATAPRDEHGLSLFCVPANTPGLTLRPLRMIDDRACADIVFDEVQLPASALLGPPDQAFPALADAHEAYCAALCAEALGVLSRLYEDTVEYTAQRRQFGQPLSRFQVLQHRLVDMRIQLELACAASLHATLHLARPPAERRRALGAAAIVVVEALRFVGENAVQLHGAMGLTDELAVSHYFRRATVLIEQLGGRDHLLAEQAKALRAA